MMAQCRFEPCHHFVICFSCADRYRKERKNVHAAHWSQKCVQCQLEWTLITPFCMVRFFRASQAYMVFCIFYQKKPKKMNGIGLQTQESDLCVQAM